MKRILVIDDEPDVAELMRLFLEVLCYEADIFLSCEEALEAINNTEYWAVFCDYMMPGLTGDKLFKAVRDADSRLAKRFIIITGAVLDERLSRFLETETVRVVNKPFRFEDIRDILTEVEQIEKQ